MNQALSIWTVYNRPRDYPDSYVARRFVVADGVHAPTDDVVLGATLDAVREQLPEGLACLQRNPNDDPVIVEVWL